jgi:secreted PhoX family phosphatase
MQRRTFLKTTVAGAASIPLQALLTRVEAGAVTRSADYGPLVPVLDEATGLPLLHLPEGFRYVSFGWTGDPMTNGQPTPGLHDGMAAYEGPNGIIRLVRNHELGRGVAFSSVSYDPAAGGGTTTIEFNGATGQYVSTADSLSGTIRNCAGGPTPWGSWLTCEETNDFTTMPHGYVFDVPAEGYGNPEPIREMGRFSHEAVAVDPASNTVYLTEDTGNTSGFYKFVPAVASDITAGGRLYMLKVAGEWQKNMYTGYPNNSHFPTEWVEIDTPDNPSPSSPSTWVSGQGRAKGAAHFGRLEGAWYDPKGDIYFVSTNGGAVGQGQIWQYNLQKGFLRLVFESPSSTVLNAPDNLTVSPRGGIVLCEDGGGTEFVHGLTRKGEIFRFAQNNVILNGERNGFTGNFTGNEFAGACYSPDGKWLFFNVQTPGITFAVTGPWNEGAL